MRFLQRLRCAACAATLLICAARVDAALLPSGTTLYPAPAEADPGPSALVNSITMPFSAPPLYSGVLTSTVLSDPANALGGLTFVYELSNDFVSVDAIHRLTINGFAGFTVDASYQFPTTDLAPSSINRSPAGTVGFNFLPLGLGPGELDPGLATALLVLETNAPTYVLSFASVINGTVTSVPSFAPAPLIPEPSTMLLSAFGAGALAAYTYYRRRRDLG